MRGPARRREASVVAEACDNDGEKIFGGGSGDGGRFRLGGFERERCFPAFADDFHGVRAGLHIIDDELAVLHFAGGLIVDGDLSAIDSFGENPHGLRRWLKRQVHQKRAGRWRRRLLHSRRVHSR